MLHNLMLIRHVQFHVAQNTRRFDYFTRQLELTKKNAEIVSEMQSTIKHYLCKLDEIAGAIRQMEQNGVTTTYQSGARSLLFTRKRQCELDLTRLNSFINHGDFPELIHYFTEDTDSEESEGVNEDPIFSLSSSGLESSCQDCADMKSLDSDELSATSTSSELADNEDFLDCSDQEWENLPVQGPSNPPLLYQSCVDSLRQPSVSTDTDLGAKVINDPISPSSSSDEEDLRVQHWRKEKFLREEFLRATMVG